MSQRELAGKIGVSHGTIHYILAGDVPRKITTLKKLASYFHTSVEKLCDDSGSLSVNEAQAPYGRAAQHLAVLATKAGRAQVRHLSRRAIELLRAQLRRAGKNLWLYPNQTGTGPIDYANFRKRVWIPACEAAGVTNARWHDWRHTFASDLTRAGHSDRTVAHLLGHTSTQMVVRYAHLRSPDLRQAVETVANRWPTAPRKPRGKNRVTR